VDHSVQAAQSSTATSSTGSLADRSRRPVRFANQLPTQVESLIVALKRDKAQW